ncbi:long-chain-fatty-acid--CoA ligase [Citricoccus parietis]|uniref:Long-chain-fatty-acid--CoA ligase n=2 Tax=Citricoccus parietis TaxID=592307 RepID=A0ABV5G3J3_9MICC
MWLYREIKTLGDFPRHYAQALPDRPAIIDAGGPLSWAGLDGRSNAMGNTLVDLGVDADDRVAFLGKNSSTFFEVLFGTSKAGAVLLPLNWRLAVPELAGIVEDAAPNIIVADAEYLDVARAVVQKTGLSPRIIGFDSTSGAGELDVLASGAPQSDPGVDVNPWSTAILMYTSGTTGKPKGVKLSHQGYLYLNLCEHLEPSFSYTSEDSMLTVMPLFHAMGLGLSLQALYNGAAVAVYSMPDPGGLIDIIERDQPTILPLIPTVIQSMLDHPRATPEAFSTLRVVVYAGAPMPPHLLKRALSTLECDFIQFYGGTETGRGVTFLRPDQHRQGVKLNSIGSPLPLIDIKIVDPLGEELPDGEVGEFLIRSPSLTTGYFNQPETTAAAFPNGWYRSGDAGYKDEDGFLFLVDRVKDMIITGGENVYSTEVEQALQQIDGVQMCAVIGVPDDKWGERVVAVVVGESDSLSEQEIIAKCRELVAGYKVPKEILFVKSLPMTGSGKIMKGEIRARLAPTRDIP